VFPITKINKSPLRIQSARNEAATHNICISLSLSHLYIITVNPSVAKKRLATTPIITPASTSTRRWCRPVKKSTAAIESSRKAATNKPLVTGGRKFGIVCVVAAREVARRGIIRFRPKWICVCCRVSTSSVRDEWSPLVECAVRTQPSFYLFHWNFNTWTELSENVDQRFDSRKRGLRIRINVNGIRFINITCFATVIIFIPILLLLSFGHGRLRWCFMSRFPAGLVYWRRDFTLRRSEVPQKWQHYGVLAI